MITGAGGVLGRHLVGMLAARGDEVLAVTSQTPAHVRALWAGHGAPDGADRVAIVPTAGVAAERVLRDVEVVIDAAFPRNIGGRALADGMRFHANLFEACERSEVGAVIDVSSQSLYDSARTTAASESDPLDLNTPYATAKYAVEILADSILRETPHLHARLASLIGTDLKQRLVNRFAARVLDGEDVAITGGDQIFDFMDVRDAAAALVALADAAVDGDDCRIINVGAGEPRTLLDIAQTVVAVANEAAGTDAAVVISDAEGTYVSSALDISRLRELTGLEPRFSLENTTGDIVRALRLEAV